MKPHSPTPTILVALLSLVTLSACHKAAETVASFGRAEIDLDSIRHRGTIRAVCDYNSVNYFVHKGVPVGYQYELLTQYAKHLGLKLEIVPDNTLEGGHDKIEKGKADILASTLVADTTLLPTLALCEPYGQSRIVLVRHTGANPSPSFSQSVDNDTVFVMSNSFYSKTLENFTDTANVNVTVRPIDHYDAEQMVGLVAEREIKQTLCLENIARACLWYYDSLEIGPAVTNQLDMAWGVRVNSPMLRDDISKWLKSFRKTALFKRIYRKYVIDPREHHNTSQSTKSDTYQAVYEDAIKSIATDKRYDWRLISSIVYQESHFNPHATSWAGAVGLMQLMPETAARFGVDNPNDPVQNISAGYEYLLWRDKRPLAHRARQVRPRRLQCRPRTHHGCHPPRTKVRTRRRKVGRQCRDGAPPQSQPYLLLRPRREARLLPRHRDRRLRPQRLGPLQELQEISALTVFSS